MRIALAQLNFTVAAFGDNLRKIRHAVEQARAAEAELVVFSELAATGYAPHDLLERDDVIERNLSLLDDLADLTDGDFGILIGFNERNHGLRGKPLFNSAALLTGGRVDHVYRKALLPTYDVFDESRHYEPGPRQTPMIFKGRRLGVTICEDMWNDDEIWPRPVYHRDPVAEQAEGGAEILLNLSASPYHTAKPALRERLVANHARKHGLSFVWVNQVGANDDLVFDGASCVCDASGTITARAKSFEEDLLIVDVPLSDEASSQPPACTALAPLFTHEADEVMAALVVGVRDYVRKSGFQQVTLGLSGGIDSALVAAVAAEALGPENVYGVAMPSRYSSDHSVTDARELAENLGIHFDLIEIEPVFGALLSALAPSFEGTDPGVAEENLQARARGVIMMGLSNKFGRLLLSTGNKSELAVGYCTLYGDMCGALSVISDVPKTLVYDISRRLNERAGRVLIPESTLTKPPSAELRPDQKDEDSLPPYEVLDEIIRLYVKEARSFEEIVEAGFEREVVRHALRLINLNEYKRRQAAPGIKVTARAFGVGRRFPLVAGYDELVPRS